MKRLFKNLLIFFVLVYAVFWFLDFAFTSIYQQGTYYKTQWLNNTENNEYDFAIHGSSRPYTCIDTKKVVEDTNLKGINISLDGSTTPTHALMLEMFLKRGNKIKTLYLNVDNWEADTEVVGQFSYPRFFPYYKEKEVYEHYSRFGLKWQLYRFIPFIRYAEQNTTWGLHQLANSLFHFKKPDYDSYGSKIYESTEYHGTQDLFEYNFDTSGKMYYLNKIIELCNSNNIELVVFVCPFANAKTDSEYYKGIEDFKEYLNNKGVKFYNFGDKYNLKFDLFVDEDHLNKNGVPLFTEDVVKMIEETK
ncbi:hypothetical protein [Marinigracilibium pacificum]|uniref:SGNH/GDSL hydrolase family protein n=1 Tax=Marinigracilibium pacificum TaxID=2729599 RepID=A0A848ISA1_9BACT|nr:hypothetical protein [Marinigracilibium pacificum]NMM47227.1 hypothetical protein [Marinigracilibium pacificum]